MERTRKVGRKLGGGSKVLGGVGGRRVGSSGADEEGRSRHALVGASKVLGGHLHGCFECAPRATLLLEHGQIKKRYALNPGHN